ncbi:hypothetical protein [Mediterraneibacter gnavus]|uniref:Uncharacterized protein n=1 Tax=Mediterraneibacter gnavus TaxID=33038 RepID=A0A2N5P3A1_MEDGN|nr:hypothetical protein [Mediterraneibacter gnavus]PLT69628.1 hypothetical protein CDL23_15725 [Mediterraneibacter gnavus]
MNNDIIGKEVVFYENNTWNHIIKEINLYTYTIEYGIKSGFSDKEQAEQSYFFFNEKFQKDIVVLCQEKVQIKCNQFSLF